MAVVDTDRNMSVDFIIRACIEESSQAGLTVGRPARVAEGPRLEYAAARVPEVIAIRQRQRVGGPATRSPGSSRRAGGTSPIFRSPSASGLDIAISSWAPAATRRRSTVSYPQATDMEEVHERAIFKDISKPSPTRAVPLSELFPF
jgi:hypothetical protein